MRLSEVLVAGAISGFAIQWLVVLAAYSWVGLEGGSREAYFGTMSRLAVQGAAPVGAFAALLGERALLKGLSDAELVKSWPILFLCTLVGAFPSFVWLGPASLISTPLAFLVACAWLGFRGKRGGE